MAWIVCGAISRGAIRAERTARKRQRDHADRTSLRGFVTDAVVPLGGGIGLVKEPTAASVLAVLQPSDDEPGTGGCVWIGNARAHLLVFSPGAMRPA
jgi:hypothetical protein